MPRRPRVQADTDDVEPAGGRDAHRAGELSGDLARGLALLIRLTVWRSTGSPRVEEQLDPAVGEDGVGVGGQASGFALSAPEQ